MKLTIIGGAGVRVPLVTNGLAREESTLAVDELALFDIDRDRVKTVARIAQAMARRVGGSLRVTCPRALDEAVDGAAFVISSIRVGGIDGRILDERIALEQGVPGQETVGPGGFALALRTIPPLVSYAREIARLAPEAWLINFTNPVGIMAEAFIREGVSDRCIGVCDTPREQFLHIAEALEVPLEAAHFDYLGLNHLGWIRSVLVNGSDMMDDLLASDEALERAYPSPLFSRSFLRELGALPTEYLYYYYSPLHAVRQTLAAGRTRGRLIRQLTQRLMQAVAAPGATDADALDAYDLYLASRNASYMSLETGEALDPGRVEQARQDLYRGAAGYERIAMDVMSAVHHDELCVMPVDVANHGAILDLDWDAAVEVPCAIDSNGARPLAAGRLPERVRNLVLQVKEYESLTVRAALAGSRSQAVDALTANPLVRRRALAETLVERYQAAHAPWLDYLQ